MKNLLFLLSTCLVSCSSVKHIQPSAAVWIFNNYIDRTGNDLSPDTKDPVLQYQFSVETELKDIGIYSLWSVDSVGLLTWFSQPAFRFDWGQADTFSYEFELIGYAQGSLWMLSYDVGAGVFDISNPLVFKGFPKGELIYSYLDLSYPMNVLEDFTVSPYTRCNIWTSSDRNSPEGGIIGHAGSRFSWRNIYEILDAQLAIDFGHDDGALGQDRTILFRTFLTLSFDLNDTAVFQPVNLMFTKPLETVHDGRRDQVMIGSGIVFKF